MLLYVLQKWWYIVSPSHILDLANKMRGCIFKKNFFGVVCRNAKVDVEGARNLLGTKENVPPTKGVLA